MRRIAEAILLPLLVAACVLTASCRRKGEASSGNSFPAAAVPSLYTTADDVFSYLTEHYWDAFFKLEGPCDTSVILGVPKAEVEQALSNFSLCLDAVSLAKADAGMARMFSLLEERQKADTSSHLYLLMTDMVSHYFYDPNSPLRNEDYYYPFVSLMASSPCTADNLRTALSYERQVCSVNRRGDTAPDFVIRTSAPGKKFRLHSVRALYTVLFFSNPGCHACREITEALSGRDYMCRAISDGKLAVVNVYVDEDLDAWKKYEPSYPPSWYNGYDPYGIIRSDSLYYLRAIPSLYLLDGEKRIIMKDAPVEKVLAFLDRELSQNQE